MRHTYPLQAFIAGKLSLVEMQQVYADLPSEELFVAIASLTADERQRLRDAVFAATLLTAIAVHEECSLVEIGCYIQRQISRVEVMIHD